jgi:hypothetical protein
LREQWTVLGVDPDQARAAATDGQAEPEPDELELPPELWQAWECFTGTWNQWRIVAGLGGVYYDGIDASSLLALMDIVGVKHKRRRAVFCQVQVLEAEARELRNATD